MKSYYLRRASMKLKRLKSERHLMTRADEAYALGIVHYLIHQHKQTTVFEAEGYEAIFLDGKWIFDKV